MCSVKELRTYAEEQAANRRVKRRKYEFCGLELSRALQLKPSSDGSRLLRNRGRCGRLTEYPPRY